MGERLCRGLTNYARTAQAAESGVRATANFAQTSFREGFSKAGSAELSKIAGAPIRTIDDLAGALRLGAIKPGQIPVNIINRGSNQLILNTRTAQALERAGIPRSQWNAVNQSGNAQFEAMLDAQLGRNQLGPSGTMLTFPE
jgi:predicted PhzF superfamily epimerase YddE/YHI9